MIRIGPWAAWLLLAAASPCAAQAPAQQRILIEIAPDASPEAVARARVMAGIEEARQIPESRVQLWRVPAGRLQQALREIRQAQGIRAVDLSGADYRSLFLPVENRSQLTAEQLQALTALEGDPDFGETQLARLRMNEIGRLPLMAGFGAADGLPAPGSFLLNLRPGLVVRATRSNARAQGKDVVLWSGNLFDTETLAPAGLASLVIDGRNISGFVGTSQGNYAIRPLGDGVHAISRISAPAASDADPARKPRATAPTAGQEANFSAQLVPVGNSLIGATADGPSKPGAAPPVDDSGQPPVIHIAVAYTRSAAKRMLAEGAGSPASAIEIALATANATFVASGISATLKLADSRQTDNDEIGVAERDVEALLDRKDGRFDELPNWRRQVGANAVILIVGELTRCGWGPAIPANAAQAYAVVRENCLRDLVIPHEIGHLFGAHHDDDPDDSPFPWGHGYVSPFKFQTIMGNSTLMTHSPIWAGPNIRWHGFATGTPDRNNDSRVVNEQARAFSHFQGN